MMIIKQKIFYVILFLFCLNCYGQNYADKSFYLVDSLEFYEITSEDKLLIDSCLNVYHQSKVDSVKFDAIVFIIENCWNNYVWPRYNDFLIDLSKRKLLRSDISKEDSLRCKKNIAVCFGNKGYFYKNIGDIENGLYYYKKSLSLLKELDNKQEMALALNNIGVLYITIGDIKGALSNYFNSLKIREEIGDKYGVLMSYVNIGYLYTHHGDPEKGIEYYKKSLVLGEEISDNVGLSHALNNLGDLLYHQGNTEEGMEYLMRSMELSKKMGDLKGVAHIHNSIGNIRKEEGKYEQALENFNISLDIRRQISDKEGEANSLLNIAQIYILLGNHKNAEINAKVALKVALATGITENIKSVSGLLHGIYYKKGEYKKAYEIYDLYIIMRDSINNIENQRVVLKQQFQYEFEKKSATDSIKNVEIQKVNDAQLATQKAENAQQKQRAYFLYFGLSLTLIFVVIIFNRLQVTRKQKQTIEKQKVIVDGKNKEITDSIQYAKRIQTAILPPQKLIKQYLQESFILYQPKDIVAGDFYWFEIEGDKIYFAAADCTGHGVPGAMVSVMCSNALTKAVKELGIFEPGKILDKAAEILEERFVNSEEKVSDGMDVALCSLNFKTKIMEYAGANNPLCLIREGVLNVTKADKQPIGKFDNRQPFTNHIVELQQGDILYIFSDGYADQFGGPKGKKFKYAQLKELLIAINNKSMREQAEILEITMENWKGNLEQIDDILVIGVKIS